jgi:hypothetical protein
MGAQQFANNLAVTVSGAIDDTQLSITIGVGQGANIPALGVLEFIKMTMAVGFPTAETAWEVVHVTGVTGDVLTVVRAQDGTTGLAWADATVLEARNTESTLENFLQKTGDTMAGTLDMNAEILDNADIQNGTLGTDLDAAGFTVNNQNNKSYTEEGFAIATIAPADILLYSNGMVQTLFLDGNADISFSGIPVGKVANFTIVFTQDATGGRTVTLPAAVTKGTLDLALGANLQTIAVFLTLDGGTSFTVMTSFKEV